MTQIQNPNEATVHKWGETFDAPALFKTIQTHASALTTVPIVDGQMIITTDTKDMYVDLDHRRLCISDIIQDTEANIKSLLAPLYGKIYFATDTNKLYQSINKNGSQEWVNLNGTDKLWSTVPSSIYAPGRRGEVAYNNNYMYICINNNRWKRLALSDWMPDFYSIVEGGKLLGTSGDCVRDDTAVLCKGTVENYKLKL